MGFDFWLVSHQKPPPPNLPLSRGGTVRGVFRHQSHQSAEYMNRDSANHLHGLISQADQASRIADITPTIGDPARIEYAKVTDTQGG